MTISCPHKYIMHLSYLGTKFSGWQIQDNAMSIQGLIMRALRNIIDKKIELIIGAGRTDSGVHAINFFAHFEWYEIDIKDVKYKINKFLPKDIVIHSIKVIKSDFHARYSALSRKYEYWISITKDPFLIDRAYFFYQDLDLKLMNIGSEILIGKKDFSSFSKSKLENNICTVKAAKWYKSRNMLIFSIEADRFLHNMVRCIVGTLIKLGLKKISLEDFSKIINSKNRSKSGYSVPACGLYLVDIYYPEKFSIENT